MNESQQSLAKDNSETQIPFKTKEEAIAKAEQAKLNGDLETALLAYVRSLDFDAEDSQVYLQIARIHAQLGNDELSFKAYQEVVGLAPQNVEARQAVGVHHLNQREYIQAKQHLTVALNNDQKRLSKQGAKKYQDYRIPDNKSPLLAYNALGVIYDMDKLFQKARDCYHLALLADPKAVNIRSNLGYSFYLSGEYKQAEQQFKQAIRQQPEFNRAWTNLGLIYARTQQYERAIKTLKQVMPEYEAYNDLGYFVMLEGRLTQAEVFFQKAIDLSPRYFKKAQVNLEQLKILQNEERISQQDTPGYGAQELESVGKK
ncbi:tetratricopeptide repeat protein [Thalassotalea litorea]|uniref:tetratricopeptide repeat protein n=1 Tax=Thalassotalea litorea TaxID=2020715 RepID=UPI003734D67A